jgi:hypothetical protein
VSSLDYSLCGCAALRCISFDEAGHSGCRSASASTVVDPGGASADPTLHLEKVADFRSLPSLLSSSVVLFNAAFLCHTQIRLGFAPSRSDRSRDRRLHAYEKFGVLFNPPTPPSWRDEWSACEGLA